MEIFQVLFTSCSKITFMCSKYKGACPFCLVRYPVLFFVLFYRDELKIKKYRLSKCMDVEGDDSLIAQTASKFKIVSITYSI